MIRIYLELINQFHIKLEMTMNYHIPHHMMFNQLKA